MQQTGASAGADVGARLAIRLLQDAAESGELDPWDVDVIAVIDGFLDQLSQRIAVPKQVAAAIAGRGGSYERDLADSSEAFLAASVLVGLKAELLEASVLPPAPEIEEGFDAEFEDQGWWILPSTCRDVPSVICSAVLWHHRPYGGQSPLAS